MGAPSAAVAHRSVCYACFKPQVACICASIEPVANRTGIVVLQHPRERFHPIGTTRIARLALQRVRVEPCAPWSDRDAMRLRLPAGAALLYPTATATDLAALPAERRPRHLVLLDATWFHARKMYDAHASIRALPHVALTPSGPSRYRIRREPQPHCIGTLEAIVDALRILEPDTHGLDALLRSFDTMITRQAAYTGQ
jgi:DTW domain-containing protein YfiP